MEQLAPVLAVVTTCLNVLSILILVWGAVIAGKDFFSANLKKIPYAERLKRLTDTKNVFGSYVLLSLEILIAADIIDSIVKPTFEDIIKLGAIVAIRTVISYFLNKEVRESGMIDRNALKK